MLVPLFLAFALASTEPLLTVREVPGLSQASVPPGAQRVAMLQLTLTASCARDIRIGSIALLHQGMGDRSDITALYAVSGRRRASRGREIASPDGDVTLTFTSPVIVPACGTQDLSILADFSSMAAIAGEHRIVLASAQAVETDGAVVRILSAEAPIRRTVGPAQGSISVSFLPLLQRIRYGDRRVVARLKVTAEGSYDQALDAITLTNDGSARNQDLIAFTLETSRGAVLARLPAMEGDRVPFVLSSPFLLEPFQTFLLTVRANVRASVFRTVGFTVEEPGDVVARRVFLRR